MKTMLVALMERQFLALWVLCVLTGLVLLVFKPGLRRELRVSWGLLLLAALCQGIAAVVNGEVHTTLSALMGGAAMVLVVLALIQLAVLLFFLVLLPSMGVQAPRIARDLAVAGLSTAWGLVWLRLSGVDATQLFTTSAIITAVLAFAMQDTLGNVLGGVMLQLDHSLGVGEWVRLDDTSGRVVDVRWRYTAIETRSGETIVVPNSWLMKNRFGVLRARPDAPLMWRRTLSFNIDATANPSAVLQALQQSVLDARIAHVSAERPASAILVDTAAGYYRYALRYWLTDPQFDDPTDSLVRVHALAALARVGVGLGVPQEERLMVKENDNWRLANEKRELQHRLEAVQRTALFATLPQEEQLALAQHLVHAPFVQGGVLTRQGAVAHWLYLIVRGRAQVLAEEAGVVTPVSTLTDGDFFGEMGMLTGEPRSATVMALTDVDCYRLDKVGFAQVLVARPEMAREISAILAQRRHDLDDRLKLAKNTHPMPRTEDLLAKIKTFFGVAA